MNYFLQVFRDCQQITSVTPNGFFRQAIKTPPPVSNGQKMDKILTKIFYIVFQFSQLPLIKVCKIQSLALLFLVVFISFYISRYDSLQVVRTSFNIIWKKDFLHKFYFLNGFIQTPHPHNNSQNLLSVIIFFFVNAPWHIAVFQDYYDMMMLGRTSTVGQN